MEEKSSKLFVFDRKEVILIFVFMILITITSFTLGVRFGKAVSLKMDGYDMQDVNTVDLKSQEEEYVDKVVAPEDSRAALEVNDAVDGTIKDVEDSNARLESEIETITKDQSELEKKKSKLEEASTSTDSPNLYSSSTPTSGKFTIQLASFTEKDQAQSFADGFLANGHDVIIQEVIIPEKGTWYRVSIGAFDSVNEAKSYLEKEKSFFLNKEYLIKQFN